MRLLRRRPAPLPMGEPGTVNYALAMLMRLQVQNMGDLPLLCDGRPVSMVAVQDGKVYLR